MRVTIRVGLKITRMRCGRHKQVDCCSDRMMSGTVLLKQFRFGCAVYVYNRCDDCHVLLHFCPIIIGARIGSASGRTMQLNARCVSKNFMERKTTATPANAYRPQHSASLSGLNHIGSSKSFIAQGGAMAFGLSSVSGYQAAMPGIPFSNGAVHRSCTEASGAGWRLREPFALHNIK